MMPAPARHGSLIAFEGLDQSGKQTQAEALRDHLDGAGRESAGCCRFPTTRRRSAAEIVKALHGERDYAPDVHAAALRRQPLREKRADRSVARRRASCVICDRYLASSIAYGEAQGLDAGVARARSSGSCRRRDLTILLDIAPGDRGAAEGGRRAIATSATSRCCRACATSYRRQARAADWVRLDGERAQGRRRGRRHSRGRDTTRAAVSARTSRGARRAQRPARTPPASRPSCSRRPPARSAVPRAAGAPAPSANALAHVRVPLRRPADRSATASRGSARSASTIGTPRCARELARLVEARARRRRLRCSGTGTTTSASASRSAAADAHAARPAAGASERRPSYLKAWRIARSVPS